MNFQTLLNLETVVHSIIITSQENVEKCDHWLTLGTTINLSYKVALYKETRPLLL